MFSIGDWAWSQAHQQYAKVIEISGLWGASFYRIWLQQYDQVVKVAADDLLHPQQAQGDLNLGAGHFISWLAVAARIANAQHEDVLLAPIESNVIPLPHQLKALNKAMSRKQVRYLFADEVGLGKTIEAGLVMRELKLRGLANRILVAAPKGLVNQWVSEMQTHFNEEFTLVIPGEQKPLDEQDNIWQRYDQVVCPVDSIKPIEKRKGWSLKQIHQYNKQRFDDVLAAGWDLVVIDEAHRLGGSTDQVARYKLGQGLAEAAPYLLLLSATPHQGKSDAFHRLIALLDPEAFPDESSVTQERVQPFVVRTEKRIAIDGEGKPLFMPRQTELVPVAWQSRHARQQHLYEEVTEYIREGYNQAKAEKQNAIGFLMILMQRLVSSSSAAIAATLERRLNVLENTVVEDNLPLSFADDWAEQDTQEQLDKLISQSHKLLENEKADVARLLAMARQCMTSEQDAKAEALLDWIYKLQQEEKDPELKILVFTEFVPTQQMLARFMEDRGISTVCLNGSMDLADRKKVQAAFAGDTRILISTDAGGEGLNLQFCHVIVNYDIPWNPMRMEQRIGRVDRIGQKHRVKALNFVLEDTVEHRVRDVLEEKLQTILEEFGVDKTSDVLDSAEANHLFDELFMETLANPELMDQELAKALAAIQEGAVDKQAQDALFTDQEDLQADSYQQAANHPLPHWVAQMVEQYLQWQKASGKEASFSREGEVLKLAWPDGAVWDQVTFQGKAAQENPALTHITLENPKVRGLCSQLPVWSEAQQIPVMTIHGLPAGAGGFWSLWSVQMGSSDHRQISYLPLYCRANGQYFAPASNRVWDAVCGATPEFEEASQENSSEVYSMVRQLAQQHGQSLFNRMAAEHKTELEAEREKGEFAFNARRKATQRIGLPEVRNYRMRLLEQEYQQWQEKMALAEQVYPELALHVLFELKA